ncbi:MAG: hypothetical protein FJ279_38270, partial [Planctomycetes bacterium]|nr:hypothetical protein [Planctomycetota bacterium]
MRSFLNALTELGGDFPKYCLWLGLSMLVGTVALLTSGSWRDRIREYGQRGGILSILGDVSSGVLRTLVGLGIIAFLSAHLITESRRFSSQHGRVTEANLASVQRIWGYPHAQRELAVQHFVETTEETEESFTDDESGRKRTKKTKTKVRNQVEQNSIVGSDVSVKIRMNYRRKGSAYYTCFEDECQFRYDVQNVTEKPTEAEFRFPLPSSEGLFDSVKITVDGRDLGPRLSYKSSRIGWTMPMQPGQKATVEIGYRSRGMDYFYYQVPEPREIRNFRLRMELADVQDLNYPEGCMTPMKITKNGKGSVLEWHLD